MSFGGRAAFDHDARAAPAEGRREEAAAYAHPPLAVRTPSFAMLLPPYRRRRFARRRCAAVAHAAAEARLKCSTSGQPVEARRKVNAIAEKDTMMLRLKDFTPPP
jgi:hypothetical protein